MIYAQLYCANATNISTVTPIEEARGIVVLDERAPQPLFSYYPKARAAALRHGAIGFTLHRGKSLDKSSQVSFYEAVA